MGFPPVNNLTNEGDISTSPPVGFVILQLPGPGLQANLIKGLAVLLPIVLLGAEYYVSVTHTHKIKLK